MEKHRAAVRAAALENITDRYRMAQLSTPDVSGVHVFRPERLAPLSLCGAIASNRRDRMPKLDIDLITCAGCLTVLAERTRPSRPRADVPALVLVRGARL